MNIKVIYFSRTGNTKKVAEAMAAAVGSAAETIDMAVISEPVDLLLLGSSIYGGKIDPSMDQFIANINSAKIKKAALFSTYAFGETANGIVRAKLESKGVKVADECFTCKGKFLFFNRKRPDADDLGKALAFAKKMTGLN